MTWAAFDETFGNAPVFVAVNHQLDPRERQRAASSCSATSASRSRARRLAGGLLLLLVALEMLRGVDFPTGDSEDVALVPLATLLVL